MTAVDVVPHLLEKQVIRKEELLSHVNGGEILQHCFLVGGLKRDKERQNCHNSRAITAEFLGVDYPDKYVGATPTKTLDPTNPTVQLNSIVVDIISQPFCWISEASSLLQERVSFRTLLRLSDYFLRSIVNMLQLEQRKHTEHVPTLAPPTQLTSSGLFLFHNEPKIFTSQCFSHTLIYVWQPPQYQHWLPHIDFLNFVLFQLGNISFDG